MSVPDLVIPVRFDVGKVPNQLGQVGAAGRKAGDDTARGFGVASSAVHGMTDSVANLMKAQIGLGAAKQVIAAIGDEYKRTADVIKTMANEFTSLRRTMQEVATLKGSANSNQFTLEEAKKAQGFGLSAAEYRDFQAEFQNYAGSQIGGEGGKLTEAQGEEYAGRVAALMKSSGINPAVGAELAGSLLENAQGPQDVDDLMKRLSTTFTVLEKGRVPLTRALPQMSQIMGHGIEAEEAAQLFAIASPVSPGQEGTAVEAALRAIQEMKNKGTGEEFGVQKGMSDFDSVKAFAQNINRRTQTLVAGGASEKAAQDEVAALLAEKGVAADSREQRGLLAGFGRQGVQLGGFERYARIAADVPADFEEARRKRYQQSDQGLFNNAAIDDEVARLEKGAQTQGAMLEQLRAKTRLTKEGDDTKFRPIDTAIRGTVGIYTGVDAEQQRINEETIYGLRQRGRALGLTNDQLIPKEFNTPNQNAVNEETNRLLALIAEASKKTADAARPPALAAPPPGDAPRGGG